MPGETAGFMRERLMAAGNAPGRTAGDTPEEVSDGREGIRWQEGHQMAGRASDGRKGTCLEIRVSGVRSMRKYK